MTRVLYGYLLCGLIFPQLTVAAERFDVPAIIAERSGLPEADITGMLQNCDKNQRNIYFCSWSDLLIAEHRLSVSLSKRIKQTPNRIAIISTRLSKIFKKRDAICDRIAKQEVGGGSDEPHEQVACRADVTDYYISHFRAPPDCGKNK